MNRAEQYNLTIKRMSQVGNGNFSPFDLDKVWADIQSVYNANKGAIAEETYEEIPITFSTGNDIVGTVLAHNGKIYMIPYYGNRIRVLDTNDDSIYSFSTTSGGGYIGGCYAPNGCIYAIPFSASKILKIDPDNDTSTTFGSFGGGSKWRGAAITADGIIYSFPHSAGAVLKVDTNNDTYSTISGFGGTNICADCVLARDGNIYSIPRNAGGVVKLNPNDDTYSVIGNVGSAQYKYLYGCIGIDENVYAIDSDAAITTLKIDVENASVSTLNVTKSGNFASVLCQNGYIYGTQYTTTGGTTTGTKKLDTVNETITRIITNINANYNSIKLAPNGCMYAIPAQSGKVLKINPNCPNKFSLSTVLSPYINSY